LYIQVHTSKIVAFDVWKYVMPTPRYATIKEALRLQITQGILAPGDRVSSENQLAAEFSVSRMTARRALLELAEDGVLLRSQGLGSFVADTRPMSFITQVRDIAEEIAQRGHQHSCRVLQQGEITADSTHAMQLGLKSGEHIFRSEIVHMEYGVPIQYETRMVNPRMAPQYLAQDFATGTPSAYLSDIAPLTEAEQSVEAILADSDISTLLDIRKNSACLKITRRTFSERGVVSLAILIHPGDRYRLGSHINY
jgi:GntR family histidine utilization transcriptional repressor